MKLIKCKGAYHRTTVENDKDKIYIFTDNTNRTSGSLPISDDSAYSKRFGKKGLRYPTMTSAVLRGLDNAFPITTQRYYKKGSSRAEGNWTDEDFKEFKKVIDEDVDVIKKACVERGIDTVIFPSGGLLNSSIADISFKRTPSLYKYIIEKEIELRDFKIK